jgi:hypothetical protein
VLLAVTPPADQQIGHHQHQRRPLRGRLIHREGQHEQRNGDDAAADAEQAAEEAERGAETEGEKEVGER